jgi:hypothetical protein
VPADTLIFDTGFPTANLQHLIYGTLVADTSSPKNMVAAEIRLFQKNSTGSWPIVQQQQVFT